MNEKENALTWSQIRGNIPVMAILIGGGLWVNNGILKSEDKIASLERSLDKVATTMEPVTNMQYRMDEAERGIKQTNTRLDNLSNTMINNVDLIRRDVNRQTTQIEVLASKLDIFMGVDSEPPKVRRSRPGGPIPADQSE